MEWLANFIVKQLIRSNIMLFTKEDAIGLSSDAAEAKTRVINLEHELKDTISVEIKLDTGAIMPAKPYESDACWDLHALKDVWLRPGESTYVPTGVYIHIPIGYEGELKTRSSLGKIGLSLHHGAFDAGYQGETAPFMYNWTNARYELSKGDRICQFCLRKVIPVVWNPVEKFAESLRGCKGHGSSGR